MFHINDSAVIHSFWDLKKKSLDLEVEFETTFPRTEIILLDQL